MTKVPTTDVDRCVRQIEDLVRAGCGLVRLAVPRRADTTAFAQIAQRVSVPLIADIHFSPARALEAIEGGAAKIRLNPGNIKSRDDIHRLIDAAKLHKVAIRIGVNEASIRDLTQEPVPLPARVDLMLAEMRQYVQLFEDRGFDRIVLSAKTSDTVRTIEVNRRIAETFQYPIHLGLTHAGLPEDARIPSAVALGTLLAEGIGDTIRVSAAGDPVVETDMAKNILIALGLRARRRPELIVCPTCGRTEIDVVKLARQVEKALQSVEKPCRVAVMGCVVNGPGEAREADIGIAGGHGVGIIFKKGKVFKKVAEEELLDVFLAELKKMENEGQKT